MNIFVLDKDPIKAAQYACNKHVSNQVKETAQILSTVQFLRNPHSKINNLIYKPTHIYSSIIKWTDSSLDNYNWLCTYGIALTKEYTYRYNRIHKSQAIIELCYLNPPVGLRKRGLQPFVQAMPLQYRNDDAVIAYRQYYNYEKSRFAKWTKREVPKWFHNESSLPKM